MTHEEYLELDKPIADELRAIEDRLYNKSLSGSANSNNTEFENLLRRQRDLIFNKGDLIDRYFNFQSN